VLNLNISISNAPPSPSRKPLCAIFAKGQTDLKTIIKSLKVKINIKSSTTKLVIFLLGFVLGIVANECFGQPQKDNSVTIIDNKVTYEVPMAYELMHIAMALTDTSIVSDGYNVYSEIIDTNSVYYKDVIKYFEQHKHHKLIQQLNESFLKSANNYGANLHLAYNSICVNNSIKKEFKYPFFHRLAYHFKSVSRKALNDFAKVSNFAQFYHQHRDFYTTLLKNVQQNANVIEQQIWLENEFLTKYDSYNIVISPLMQGTHFTKHYKRKQKNNCIMWVARFDAERNQTQSINSAKYTGVVMTEIDHNYVNPVSDKYKNELNNIMGENNRNKWTSGSFSNSYKTGYKVFNEYMTHSVYLLYTNQKLNEEEQKAIEKSKITGMENRRKFVKFGKFYEALKQIYKNRNPNETLTDLYPQIIEWCRTENTK
jgi:hypothetical protein